jgi:hypothetical protein
MLVVQMLVVQMLIVLYSTPRAHQRNRGTHGEKLMAKYLISFPSAAMDVPDSEFEAVSRDAHAVIREAKEAGVYVPHSAWG